MLRALRGRTLNKRNQPNTTTIATFRGNKGFHQIRPTYTHFTRDTHRGTRRIMRMTINNRFGISLIPLTNGVAIHSNTRNVTVNYDKETHHTRNRGVIPTRRLLHHHLRSNFIRVPKRPNMVDHIGEQISKIIISTMRVNFNVNHMPNVRVLQRRLHIRRPSIQQRVLIRHRQRLYHQSTNVNIRIRLRTRHIRPYVNTTTTLSVKTTARRNLRHVLGNLNRTTTVKLRLGTTMVNTIMNGNGWGIRGIYSG